MCATDDCVCRGWGSGVCKSSPSKTVNKDSSTLICRRRLWPGSAANERDEQTAAALTNQPGSLAASPGMTNPSAATGASQAQLIHIQPHRRSGHIHRSAPERWKRVLRPLICHRGLDRTDFKKIGNINPFHFKILCLHPYSVHFLNTIHVGRL